MRTSLRCSFPIQSFHALLWLIVALGFHPVHAQEPTGDSTPKPLGSTSTEKGSSPKITLRVGDPAPALKVSKWLKGEPLAEYSKDNFYVVEFWATWCMPCIKSMPHLHEIAQQYADKGLKVIAVTTADDANTLAAVTRFVEGKGKSFEFSFAFCEGKETIESFMTAAGRDGIPCSFVIDRAGQVAYVGLPADLDYVLSRVANGSWRGQPDIDELEEMNKSINSITSLAITDPAKALEIIAHIERVNPKRSLSMDFAYAKTFVMCIGKKFDDAKSTIEKLKPEYLKLQQWGGLATTAGMLMSQQMNPERIHYEFAESLMQEAHDHAKDDWQGLLEIAMGYQLAGRKEDCLKCVEEAIEKCPDLATKEALKQTAKQFSKLFDSSDSSR